MLYNFSIRILAPLAMFLSISLYGIKNEDIYAQLITAVTPDAEAHLKHMKSVLPQCAPDSPPIFFIMPTNNFPFESLIVGKLEQGETPEAQNIKFLRGLNWKADIHFIKDYCRERFSGINGLDDNHWRQINQALGRVHAHHSQVPQNITDTKPPFRATAFWNDFFVVLGQAWEINPSQHLNDKLLTTVRKWMLPDYIYHVCRLAPAVAEKMTATTQKHFEIFSYLAYARMAKEIDRQGLLNPQELAKTWNGILDKMAPDSMLNADDAYFYSILQAIKRSMSFPTSGLQSDSGHPSKPAPDPINIFITGLQSCCISFKNFPAFDQLEYDARYRMHLGPAEVLSCALAQSDKVLINQTSKQLLKWVEFLSPIVNSLRSAGYVSMFEWDQSIASLEALVLKSKAQSPLSSVYATLLQNIPASVDAAYKHMKSYSTTLDSFSEKLACTLHEKELKALAQKKDQERSKIESATQKHQKDLSELRAKLQDRQQTIDQLNAQVKKLEKKPVEDKESRLAGQVATLKSQLEETNTNAAKTLKTETDRLQKIIDEQFAEMKRLQAVIKGLEANQRAEVGRLTEQLQKTRKTAEETLTGEKTRLQKIIDEQLAEMKRLQAVIKGLEGRQKEHEQALAEKDKAIFAIQSAITGYKSAHDQNIMQMAQMKDTIQTLQKEIGQLRQQPAMQRSPQTAGVSAGAKGFTTYPKSDREQSTAKDLEHFRGIAHRLQLELQKTRAEFSTERGQMQRALQEKSNQIAQLQSQNANGASLVQSAQKDRIISEQCRAISLFQSQQEEERQKISELEKTITELRKQIQEMEGQLSTQAAEAQAAIAKAQHAARIESSLPTDVEALRQTIREMADGHQKELQALKTYYAACQTASKKSP